MRTLLTVLCSAIVSVSSPVGASAAAPPQVRVTVADDLHLTEVSGRLLVFLIQDGSGLPATTPPVEGPFWAEEQPAFGVTLTGRNITQDPVLVGDAFDAYPKPYSALKPGTYRVQARLERFRDRSNWRDHDGNLFTDEATMTVADGEAGEGVMLVLSHQTSQAQRPKLPGVEWFSVRSRLLSAFRGKDVTLRAGVVLPTGFDPKSDRKFPAIYHVPGYGGDDRGAIGESQASAAAPAGSAQSRLSAEAFTIVLDPESPNGHTLFTDSANNGPCGRALVEELLPALEAKYPLIASPSARLLRGHSSGGWSTLWLALTYPKIFGAAWSSSPDPVDFRRFQRSDIYSDTNMFVTGGDKPEEVPSYRAGGVPLMTVRREVGGERVIGPGNTSAQQWASWQAVWGPKDASGRPAALVDPRRGFIDRAIAEQYKRFDIGELVRNRPGEMIAILDERVRLFVGDQDSFYLNEAVELLKQDVERLRPKRAVGAEVGERFGCIEILPGFDHGSIFASEPIKGIAAEMTAFLERAGHIAKQP